MVACCAAHVYTQESDGTLLVECAACLECGTWAGTFGLQKSRLLKTIQVE